jgi:twitching motility protein PilT
VSEYLDSLLAYTLAVRASDLHLRSGLKPQVRIDGDLKITEGDPVSAEVMDSIAEEILLPEQREELERQKAVDFSYRAPSGRFRVNIFRTGGHLGAVFRAISEKAPTLADIGAPVTLLELARQRRGLVLVTGPTGSGKSTTLAAMIDLINTERSEHILTIEDPIEFVHRSKRCLVTQREVGRDATDFASALRHALREDPDVILVGEMRDLETISIALTAAETGHLVLGTLHTSSAPGTIDRVIDAFPGSQQQQARVMLGNSLLGVVSQSLLPRSDGQGRVAAHEIMMATNPVRALIRKQDVVQMRSVLQTNIHEGMQTMDRALVSLVIKGLVAEDLARNRAQNIDEFDQLMQRARSGTKIEALPLIEPDSLVRSMTPETEAGPEPSEPSS